MTGAPQLPARQPTIKPVLANRTEEDEFAMALTIPDPTHIYVQKCRMAERRALESGTLLSELHKNLPQARSEAFSSSAEDILRSGALTGSAKQKAAIALKTKARRIAAHMTLDSKTVAQTRGWRIRAAYRMVVYMARITGDLYGPMTLSQLFSGTAKKDPSQYPFLPRKMNGAMYGMKYIEDVIVTMQGVDSVYSFDAGEVYGAGMTFLPPPVPDAAWPGQDSRTIPLFRSSCMEPSNYNPEHDELLNLWLDAYDHLAAQLRISDGSEEEPEAGIFGTVGMFSANAARFLWPTRDELLLYEQELLLCIFDKLCRNSTQKAENDLVTELGYGRPEAVMACKTAARYGTAVYQEDFDMHKVKELKALEIISDTAGAGDDPRAQIAARKQLHLVSGLTKNEDRGSLEAFRELGAKALEEKDFIDV